MSTVQSFSIMLQRRWRRLTLLALTFTVFLFGSFLFVQLRSNPKFFFLADEGSAQWISFEQPPELGINRQGTICAFRLRFSVPKGNTYAKKSVLVLRAFGQATVAFDGNVLESASAPNGNWKAKQHFDLTGKATPGTHELVVLVTNTQGMAALWASCEPLSLHTGLGWETSHEGSHWIPAHLASERSIPKISLQFKRVDQALLEHLVLFGLVFLAGATLVPFWHRWRLPAVSAVNVRWLVLMAYALMASNNLFKVLPEGGFDVFSHIEYIDYLIQHRRIPLASDGWQMFQSPFYYLVSAPLFFIFQKLTLLPIATLLLRLVPLLCGLLQIEIAYRAACRVFPDRSDLKILVTLFAGFLPVNLYMSHYVSNEPMVGLLSSAVILGCLRLLETEPSSRAPLWPIGLLLGLALLTKVTAGLLVGPVLLALAFASFLGTTDWRSSTGRFCRNGTWVFGLAALTAGWYYVRNWIYLGQPFVGGWSMERGMNWWQYPGYRTWHDVLQFGEVFVHPIYIGLRSVWDGLYASWWADTFLSGSIQAEVAPPWNFDFLIASVGFAVVPTLAFFTGFLHALRDWTVGRQQRMLWFAAICAGVYCVVLFTYIFSVPYFCSVKTSYIMGMMPVYALLAASGFDLLTRHPVPRALLHGATACFIVSVYLAYFAR